MHDTRHAQDATRGMRRGPGGLYELDAGVADPELSNADLAPTRLARRTWSTYHVASLWVGLSVCIPTYMLASSLVGAGMDWKQAVFTIMLGNLLVCVPMVLIAHAGTRYGIPFPVLARASFGTLGSNVPALLRAVVACGWFGIQTWIGGQAIYTMMKVAAPQYEPPFAMALGFALFWLANIYVVVRGSEWIKALEAYAAPFLIVSGLALLWWATSRAGGLGPILERPSRFATTGEFLAVFVPSLTAMVGFWATLALNIPDLSRYARDQRAQVWGQFLGLPTTMTLFAFIGVAVTSASDVIFGEPIWDPVQLLSRIESPLVVLAEQLIGKGIALSVYDPDVSLSRLLGANRRFIDAHLPHIGDLIRPSIAEAVQGADVIVVGTTNPAVLAATDFVMPGMEVIDSRFRDFKFDLPSVIADNTSAARYVLGGKPCAPDEIDMRTTGLVLEKNGELMTFGAGAAVLNHPATAIAMLANPLGARGEEIPAGAVILSGGITEAVAVKAGDAVTLRMQGMGSVSLRFV